MAFIYKNNTLCVQTKDQVKPIAEVIGTYEKPTYVYDLNEMLRRIGALKEAFKDQASIHYAMKANHNPEILKTFASLGIGADTVSGGEIDLALAAGFKAKNLVFSGVGKTLKEIRKAVDLGIKQINVESPAELRRIGECAKEKNKTVTVAFRMNPDVNPETHPYIKTGFRDNKFGMDQSFMPELENILDEFKDHLSLVGLTIHIGSQLQQTHEFVEAINKTRTVWDYFKNKGYQLKTMDIGGGLGLDYKSENTEKDYELIAQYGKVVLEALKPFEAEVLIEPGRIITARAGILVAQVQYIKCSPYKNFVIVDTGMHHLLRPSLYQAYHRIEPLNLKSDKKNILYDVVGPICESSDVLGFDRLFPSVQQDDLMVIFDAGAYGYSMANSYNCHSFPEEIIVT